MRTVYKGKWRGLDVAIKMMNIPGEKEKEEFVEGLISL